MNPMKHQSIAKYEKLHLFKNNYDKILLVDFLFLDLLNFFFLDLFQYSILHVIYGFLIFLGWLY